ncbi:MAG: YidH family protein [Pirellula sp.]|jgi:putative membrane protein
MNKTDLPSALPLDTPTRLAIERTRVAYERTVMSSVRTASSLITFGFTIYKFFQFDIPGKAPRGLAADLLGPRELGITMIIMGLASLLFGWLEYQRDIKSLRILYPEMPNSTSGVITAMIAMLGVVLLIVTIVRG